MQLRNISLLLCATLYVRCASDQPTTAQLAVDEPLQDSKCRACFNCFDVKKAPIMLCGHTYCPDCMHVWLKHNSTCPSCRAFVALSSDEIEKFNSVGFEFPSQMLEGTFRESYNKFFIPGGNLNVHANSALLRFIKDIAKERDTGVAVPHDTFARDYLYPLLQLTSVYKLKDYALARFTSNFQRSLDKLSASEIEATLLKGKSREDLIKLLVPTFGVCPSIGEKGDFVYTGQKIKFYTALGIMDISNLRSLTCESCKINHETLDDIRALLEAPSLENLVLSEVYFYRPIRGISLRSVKNLVLDKISGSIEFDEDVQRVSNFAEDSLNELLSASAKLTHFKIRPHPGNVELVQFSLKKIAALKCKLELLKMDDHYSYLNSATEYTQLLARILRNSRMSLKSLSFNHQELLYTEHLDDFLHALTELVVIDTLDMREFYFRSEYLHGRLMHALRRLRGLRCLGLGLDLSLISEEEDMKKLEMVFLDMNLQHLSLTMRLPGSAEELANIERILELQPSLEILDITLDIPVRHNDQPRMLKKTVEMLRSQVPLKRLTVKHDRIFQESPNTLFKDISTLSLDRLTIECFSWSSNPAFYEELRGTLRNTNIKSLEICIYCFDDSSLNAAIAQSLAKINESIPVRLTMALADFEDKHYLNFFEALSSSKSVKRLRLSNNNRGQWDGEVCKATESFKGMDISFVCTKRAYMAAKGEIVTYFRDTDPSFLDILLFDDVSKRPARKH